MVRLVRSMNPNVRMTVVCLLMVTAGIAGLVLIPISRVLARSDVLTVQFTVIAQAVSDADGWVTFTVELSAPSTETVTVQFTTMDGDAIAPIDYVAASGTVVFKPGETMQTISVQIVDNKGLRGVRHAYITLSNPQNAKLGMNAKTVFYIGDMSKLPTVQFGSAYYSVNESAGTATIEVTLSFTPLLPVTVNYATADGPSLNGAVAGVNYTATSGVLTFAPGETSKRISVPIIADANPALSKIVMLDLDEPCGATYGIQITSNLTIIDDDIPVAVTFSPAPVAVNVSEWASLTANIFPPEAASTIVFESADPTFATVAPGLIVTGVWQGTTAILAKLNGNAIAFVTVNVQDKNAILIDPIATKTDLDPNGPINQIVNPAAIVVVEEKDRTKDNAAIIQITSPNQVGNDIEWTVKGNARKISGNLIAGGEAKIFEGNVGKTIRAHGVQAGFVLFEVRKTGNPKVLETYEAFVFPLKNMPFRVNLLQAKDGTGTKATVPLAEQHIKLANIYLRQVAIALVPDTDETVTEKEGVKLIKTGFFEGTGFDAAFISPNGLAAQMATLRINARPFVTQINYLDNMNSIKGICPNWPGSMKAGSRVETWSYRATVNTAIDTYKMEVSGPNLIPKGKPDNIWGVLIENTGNGDPDTKKQIWGNTIAHELGHLLTLRHRNPKPGFVNDTFNDRAAWPALNGAKASVFNNYYQNNAMCFSAPAAERTDFDQFQMIIMQLSDAFLDRK